ncbi:unnamed protein product [Spirodela intermedia]|nr:unnamed protein product [Spirodela intermedia]CAA6659201.1 unnamed protein product [Spirodela intermedia]
MKEVSMALHLLRSSDEHPWIPQHTPEEVERLLDREQATAYDSADVVNSYLCRKNHTILEIEAGR